MAPAPDSLTRREFARILGLPEDAPSSDLQTAAERLLDSLRVRSELGPGLEKAEAAALAVEMATLEAARVRWASGAATTSSPKPPPSTAASANKPQAVDAVSQLDRSGLAGALIGAALMLLLLIAYASGYRIEKPESEGFAAAFEKPARLILTGRMPGATLRVMDADRQELFVKTAAEGASVELREGRYALEVSREDCPDKWTRSQYFEAGATHRFEPFLCGGEARLTIRTSVPADRLQIDGFDLDPKQATPHSLSVGDHTVRIEKKGYTPYEARIRLGPEEEMDLRAELAAHGASQKRKQRKAPPGVETPSFEPPSVVAPVPFDLGNLKQEIAPQNLGTESTSALLRAGLEGFSNGGSTAWHDRVSGELVGRFDTDGSGLIDRVDESDAISCAVWREIQTDFDRGRLGLSMARYYGFDGTEWHPNALGFARRTRSAAYAKMKECGLRK